MKCQVCNAEAPASATFCQQCGAKLAGAGETAPVGAKTASVSAAQTATNDAPGAGQSVNTSDGYLYLHGGNAGVEIRW